MRLQRNLSAHESLPADQSDKVCVVKKKKKKNEKYEGQAAMSKPKDYSFVVLGKHQNETFLTSQ